MSIVAEEKSVGMANRIRREIPELGKEQVWKDESQKKNAGAKV